MKTHERTPAPLMCTPSDRPEDVSATERLRDLSAQIVEVATDAIISKDRGGVITSWNLGAERLYGYTAQEAVGIPISFLIPKELKGEEHRLLERVLDGEHIDYYETQRACKDASKVSVSLTLFALRGEHGEIIGAASIAHDISRQVSAEEDLQRSEGRYRQILESAHAGIWQVNPEMLTAYVNPSLARMLGYTVEELLGRPLSDFLDQQQLDNAKESMRRQSSGDGERLEQTFRHKDGSEVQTLMSVNAVLDDAGEHVGNLAIVTDVTEQRMAEAHLRKAGAFLAGLSESMDEGLFVLGVDGRIATLNRAAERSLGYSAEELAGRTLCGALGCGRDEQRSCTASHCRLTEVSSSSSAVRIDDTAFVCKDGTRLAVDLSAAPLGDEHDGFSGRVVVFRDISERRRSEGQAQRELDEMSWIGRLRDAMDEDRLVVAAQPIVALATGEVSSQELLVRLRDRAGELVVPGKFLPAAERFGLIGALDCWVIGKAARMAARGQAVNVNLSAQSLGDPELADLIEARISQEQADAALITFEITETALMENLHLAGKFTARMATLGCSFALDDFGTGYGAFTYLKTLPIKHLKIDIEFVRDLLENEASQHLVAATVQLARSFGQMTVAEGVEDARTLERLRELEVDYAQGYYLGRPEIVEVD
ncbi:MAG TPA: PAS domain S-box protein [Solirubrobacteraceae bacterium]